MIMLRLDNLKGSLVISVVVQHCDGGAGLCWLCASRPVLARSDGEVAALSGQRQGKAQRGTGGVYLGSDTDPQRHCQS